MDLAIERNQVNIEDEMRRSYLDYAMSVIIGRALPDVRDGLKPVHRRVLWAMQELGNYHNKAYKKSARVVGVAFIGKNPPKSYLDDPAKLFEISHREDGGLWHVIDAQSKPDESRLPKELRRHSRYSIPANIIVEKVDGDGNVLESEPTVTENLSLGGAAVFTSLNVEIGSFVRVKSEQYNVSIISVVRGRRIAPDGVPRLHLEFVDRFFPLEGIE
jgi:hypothetical protein